MNKPSHSLDWVSRSLASVWHPCTQMKDHEAYPLIAIASGNGPWLEDTQGRRFIDAISSWWTNLFGHANPRINQAIVQQLQSIEHVMLAGFTHQPVVELSERLSTLTNGHLGHAFYASDGASAVEIALKMSHHFWKIQGKPNKKEFICLANSYHGETLGALSVTDVSIFRDAYGSLLNPAHIVMSPDSRAATEQISSEEVIDLALKSLEECLAQHHQTIAALIIEPLVQCAGQMAMHAPRYVKGAKQLCEQYDVHLIADEIAVGCGRTGTFFACEQAGIWPDLMTLSKGISAGYLPLSICLSTDRIYSAFYSDRMTATFLHSHSYTGNPLACRAALAGLDIFQEDAVLEKNKVRSQSIQETFVWTRDHVSIEHVRQQGMIMAFDVKASAISNPGSFSKAMFQEGLQEGVLIRPIGRTVYVMPPYILSADEVQQMSRAIERTLHAVLQKV
ncbi:MAG: adenosylmethionine--8-amino-7-oxononanoate transaminase [Polynucleobacter sp.]|nr:adenosylmethionine--8-amino-7-oxononanoate transaminase [Polynucleobacter sp.]